MYHARMVEIFEGTYGIFGSFYVSVLATGAVVIAKETDLCGSPRKGTLPLCLCQVIAGFFAVTPSRKLGP